MDRGFDVVRSPRAPFSDLVFPVAPVVICQSGTAAAARSLVNRATGLRHVSLLVHPGMGGWGFSLRVRHCPGKTAFALGLARCAQANVVVVAAPDVRDRHVGESEERLTHLFRQASVAAAFLCPWHARLLRGFFGSAPTPTSLIIAPSLLWDGIGGRVPAVHSCAGPGEHARTRGCTGRTRPPPRRVPWRTTRSAPCVQASGGLSFGD